MRLYCLRHAEALEGLEDAARPLSEHGREQSRLLGRFLRRAGIRFDAAYTSTLVRARQTAELVLATCGEVEPGSVQAVDVLGLAAGQRQFSDWLQSLPEARHVLLVGHAPTLEARVRALVGIRTEAGLRLPKGAMACVETEDGLSGRLRFLVTPKLLDGVL